MKFYLKCKRLHKNAKLPSRAYNSAGYDVFPLEELILPPKSKIVIPLGFSAEFPVGYACVVDDRSSTGNACLMHLAGVLDGDYRDEYKIIMYNLNDNSYHISPNKAIAQLLFLKVEEPEPEWVDELSETERGTKHFGSTDVRMDFTRDLPNIARI